MRRLDPKDGKLILPPPRRGVYSIGIQLREPLEVRIRGKPYRLEIGNYVYTGSALGAGNNLHTRIRRHLLGMKKEHWHLDQITNSRHTSISFVVFSETDRKMECIVNKAASEFAQAETPLPGFGSSDCRSGCKSHLLRLGEKDNLTDMIRAYESLGLNPKTLEVKREKLTGRREKNQVRIRRSQDARSQKEQ